MKIHRAWFSRLYDIQPGNGGCLFLQPWSLQGAIDAKKLERKCDQKFKTHQQRLHNTELTLEVSNECQQVLNLLGIYPK